MDWLEANSDLRSLSDRKDQLRWASKYLVGKPLATIDRHTLDDLAKRKAATGVSPATVNRHLAAISAILGHAHRKEWIDAVPAVPRRREPHRRPAYATQEQALRLIAALPPHWAAITEFALATGLRKSNITRLRWSAIDFGKRTVVVHADEAKGARTIALPLSDAAIAVLGRQRGAHRSIVFPYQGRMVERIEARLWKQACKAAGLVSFRFHDTRHVWASWHVANGTDLQTLMELGGWRSLSMVLKYAHLMPSRVAAAANNSGLKQERNRSRFRKRDQPRKAA